MGVASTIILVNVQKVADRELDNEGHGKCSRGYPYKSRRRLPVTGCMPRMGFE